MSSWQYLCHMDKLVTRLRCACMPCNHFTWCLWGQSVKEDGVEETILFPSHQWLQKGLLPCYMMVLRWNNIKLKITYQSCTPLSWFVKAIIIAMVNDIWIYTSFNNNTIHFVFTFVLTWVTNSAKLHWMYQVMHNFKAMNVLRCSSRVLRSTVPVMDRSQHTTFREVGGGGWGSFPHPCTAPSGAAVSRWSCLICCSLWSQPGSSTCSPSLSYTAMHQTSQASSAQLRCPLRPCITKTTLILPLAD